MEEAVGERGEGFATVVQMPLHARPRLLLSPAAECTCTMLPLNYVHTRGTGCACSCIVCVRGT
jgi:hypothetical protein